MIFIAGFSGAVTILQRNLMPPVASTGTGGEEHEEGVSGSGGGGGGNWLSTDYLHALSRAAVCIAGYHASAAAARGSWGRSVASRPIFVWSCPCLVLSVFVALTETVHYCIAPAYV